MEDNFFLEYLKIVKLLRNLNPFELRLCGSCLCIPVYAGLFCDSFTSRATFDIAIATQKV